MRYEPGVLKGIADGKKGMTFKELREFVTLAMRADVRDDRIVKVVGTFRGTIKELGVEYMVVPETDTEIRKVSE